MKKEYIQGLKNDIDEVINSNNSILSEFDKLRLIEHSKILQKAISDKNLNENSVIWIPLILKAISIVLEYLKSPPI